MPTLEDVHYGCHDTSKPFEHHWVLCMDMHSTFLEHFTKTADIERVTCQDCHKRYRSLEPLLGHTHFLHRGASFYCLQIPCLKSLEYPSFGPIPSTCHPQEVTCPQCLKYVARKARQDAAPRKIVQVFWCGQCDKWRAIARPEKRSEKPCPCPMCQTIMNTESSNSSTNPAPCIHIEQVTDWDKLTPEKLAKALNKCLSTYPQESTWTYDALPQPCSLLTIYTPRTCPNCKQTRRVERERKATEHRRRQWVKHYMQEDGMTQEEAEEAVYDAEQNAQGDAHEAWTASLSPDEHPWVDNPD